MAAEGITGRWEEVARRWSPPDGWVRIATVDAHAGGEPLRVIVAGFPTPRGATMLERRRDARERLDDLRTALMWEPRGHADMYGALLTEPATPDADLGVLFLHNEGYSTMCGHGIIALTRVVLELGLFPMERPVTRLEIDTPAGRVRASARIEDRRVAGVCFRNVPSFVVALDDEVEVPGVGRMRYDLGFGGAFYAYVRAEDVGLRCEPEAVGRLVELGGAVKDAVMEARPVEHPTDPDLGFLYGTIFTDPASGADAHSRNVCIFADGEVDRSPTGTGVSGRLAIEHARGRLPVGETFVVESIIGTRFVGRIVEETEVGPYPGVVPEVEGQAYITGRHEFWVDPDDPLGHGFLLR